jgi:hypothetical protein
MEFAAMTVLNAVLRMDDVWFAVMFLIDTVRAKCNA